MAKKRAKKKKTFDSYIYSGAESIKTTEDWISFLKGMDSGSPKMVEMLEKERETLKDDPQYQGYQVSLEAQKKTLEKENQIKYLDMFRRSVGKKGFRNNPFLKTLSKSIEEQKIIKVMGGLL